MRKHVRGYRLTWLTSCLTAMLAALSQRYGVARLSVEDEALADGAIRAFWGLAAGPLPENGRVFSAAEPRAARGSGMLRVSERPLAFFVRFRGSEYEAGLLAEIPEEQARQRFAGWLREFNDFMDTEEIRTQVLPMLRSMLRDEKLMAMQAAGGPGGTGFTRIRSVGPGFGSRSVTVAEAQDKVLQHLRQSNKTITAFVLCIPPHEMRARERAGGQHPSLTAVDPTRPLRERASYHYVLAPLGAGCMACGQASVSITV